MRVPFFLGADGRGTDMAGWSTALPHERREAPGRCPVCKATWGALTQYRRCEFTESHVWCWPSVEEEVKSAAEDVAITVFARSFEVDLASLSRHLLVGCFLLAALHGFAPWVTSVSPSSFQQACGCELRARVSAARKDCAENNSILTSFLRSTLLVDDF